MPDEHQFDDYFRYFRAEFLQEANAESRDGDVQPDFKENVLTRLIVEQIEDQGISENAEVCHCEARKAKGLGKVNGYSISDDGDEIGLFTTILTDSDPPATVAGQDVREAAERAVRFLQYARAGLYRELEPSSDACAMSRRIFEASTDLRRVRVFVITDGRVAKVALRSSKT